MNKKWKIWVDTGGTFTDCLAETPEGEIKRVKVLSSSKLRGKAIEQVAENAFQVDTSFAVNKRILNDYKIKFLGQDLPDNSIASFDPNNFKFTLTSPIPNKLLFPCDFELDGGEEAPVLAARLITETALDNALPPIDMRLGTTRGTNALLERKGANTAWLVTKGLKDLIRIGTQQRPDIFALKIEKPEPLYSNVFEINERIDAEGNVLITLNSGEVEQAIEKIKEKGILSVAISLLNSFKNPAHELEVLDLCEKAGLTYVSVSSQLFPAIKLLPRAETAVADAYLNPILSSYLTGVSNKLSSGSSLKVMSSAGGLISANDFYAKDSLLSGPAGGVVGAAEIAKVCGEKNILTLDMGGTSTDVSRYAGKPDYCFECEVGQAKIASPSVAVETVAAGGGSICSFDGHKLAVGPESAGAQPGPACYGAVGPLTVTDVNLLLGRVDEEKFGIPVQKGESAKRLEEQLNEINNQTGERLEGNSLLEGYLQIANERMAEAIRNISTRKGYDPAEHALLAFGGAGGQHACAIAELLGMKKIIVPFDAGLLSAYGIGKAVEERMATQQVLKPLDDLKNDFEIIVATAADDASSMLRKEGILETETTFVAAYLRFSGQDAVIEVEAEKYSGLHAAFKSKYEELFGHWVENRAIEVESIKVKVSALKISKDAGLLPVKVHAAQPQRTKEITHQGKQLPAQLYDWESLSPGAKIEGPALLASKTSTTWIAPGWQANVGHELNAILDLTEASSSSGLNEVHETVALELFTNRFRGIAEEMGTLLMRTAFSVNIKERLDFSCALLDPKGDLVVNAPHIPVHLGGLGLCVRKVLEVLPLGAGDVAVTNHPGFGGSHLPDITLIAPAFEGTKLLGYVANRAHHAELGGKRPGSMPPDAKNLAEEGVVINPMLLIQKGEARWSDIEKVLTAHSHPTRAVAENMADLNAALSSIKAGQSALLSLCQKEGAEKVLHYMQRLKDYSNEKLWVQLQKLPGNEFEATEKLDDGSPLKVKLQRTNDKLTVDFTGSSRVHPGNLNATPAIVRSAVIYVLRLLISENIPLNEGIMKQVEIILPEGLLNPPFPADSSQCPAVVGGNTEVSQRLVDTLIKALKLSACSQGTMNNLLFGNKSFGYYETICGGTGAGPGFHGADAIHHHMTNTRITDPEIMEWRYPVQVEEFSIRKGSGGPGKWKGGDGIVRKLRFTEAVELTLLTQHRVEVPYGMKGGKPGATGKQFVEKSNGSVVDLKGVDEMDLQAGDAIVIETPGGGGWGS
ncbi:MAG: hydantoinase B/oxoprolinase family protein [Imperialibacter sp.]|uniref:hydantoinase B/oxoprolinase family protein n=1 Tax=Imperialibacter sp. TaxID=2038411 RepID=UPI0032ED5F2A